MPQNIQPPHGLRLSIDLNTTVEIVIEEERCESRAGLTQAISTFLDEHLTKIRLDHHLTATNGKKRAIITVEVPEAITAPEVYKTLRDHWGAIAPGVPGASLQAPGNSVKTITIRPPR